jgi:hypothetical protein
MLSTAAQSCNDAPSILSLCLEKVPVFLLFTEIGICLHYNPSTFSKAFDATLILSYTHFHYLH